MSSKLFAFRLHESQVKRLNELKEATGLDQSEIVRRLIDSSKVVTKRETVTVSNVATGALSPNQSALAAAV